MGNFDLVSILPDVILIGFAFALLLAGGFVPSERQVNLNMLAGLGFLMAIVANFIVMGSERISFFNMFMFDNLAGVFRFIFYGVGFLVALLSEPYICGRIRHKGEYYALVTLSSVGMSFMATSYDLIMLVLGLETMSLSVYVLTGLFKTDERSVEASMKYFLLGAFSTAIMLLGIAFIYGALGTTSYGQIVEAYQKMGGEKTGILLAGVGLVLAGVLFKIAAVPFHMWTPDVYEGAPSSVTAFMISGVKAASFVMLIRVFALALKIVVFDLTTVVMLIAAVTMTLGNVTALLQRNVKRMLAYSSIAHAGYILVGFVALNKTGLAAIIFYLVAYALMNIGAFAVLVLFEDRGNYLDQLSGSGFKYPFLGLMMTIFMFSMVGLPPTGGFMGKFYIFKGALEAGYVWLVVLAVLNSAVSAYFYLRVLVYMFFEEFSGAVAPSAQASSVNLTLLITSIGILYLGIFPQSLFALTERCMTYLP
ncbi:NADH-quinone oxidoreductase subunit N [Thermodesulforhabdus norvegica]|uniref:NADH-quinone oxidoreductase subunit N n=1 Tax=Thermodesulforhabdus norvegica TaxID=39841 RepID=A0A1I4UJM2_9BACT|nr:NADH-quinone oxidoreductase subunit N [Thermodesulforhabdus norvegica]SFM89101.1 NADH-quinone oxidoreductase subunit N [Thermodesulforhabdus norvegica]